MSKLRKVGKVPTMDQANIETKVQKPSWLKVKIPHSDNYREVRQLLKSKNLVTVCQEALCPNIEECWSSGTATFMLLGDTCTRACKFCSINTGNPKGVVDHEEPFRVGSAIASMNLEYVVLTSVDRDDLSDFGSTHFAKTIEAIKTANPKLLVEVLTPDFNGDVDSIQTVLNSKPDVFAHNIETTESLTPNVRDRRSSYRQSLDVLFTAKKLCPKIITKTSIMLGLGESETEIIQTLKDLREVKCDVVTFGQYLSPTKRHDRYLPVFEYVDPRIFENFKTIADNLGFLYVASGPLVRSSYKAGEYFLKNYLNRSKMSMNESH
jgi:lipoyl synthase